MLLANMNISNNDPFHHCFHSCTAFILRGVILPMEKMDSFKSNYYSRIIIQGRDIFLWLYGINLIKTRTHRYRKRMYDKNLFRLIFYFTILFFFFCRKPSSLRKLRFIELYSLVIEANFGNLNRLLPCSIPLSFFFHPRDGTISI